MNVLLTFDLVRSEMKLINEKAFFMSKAKIDQHSSSYRNLLN